jgi:hypothetical protein
VVAETILDLNSVIPHYITAPARLTLPDTALQACYLGVYSSVMRSVRLAMYSTCKIKLPGRRPSGIVCWHRLLAVHLNRIRTGIRGRGTYFQLLLIDLPSDAVEGRKSKGGSGCGTIPLFELDMHRGNHWVKLSRN